MYPLLLIQYMINPEITDLFLNAVKDAIRIVLSVGQLPLEKRVVAYVFNKAFNVIHGQDAPSYSAV